MLQGLGNPLIQTFLSGGRFDSYFAMQLRRNSQAKPAGVLPERLDALLLADLKKHLQRLSKSLAQFIRRFAVKIGSTVESKDLSPEQIKVRVIFDSSLVAVYGHDAHGVTPWLSNQLRTL